MKQIILNDDIVCRIGSHQDENDTMYDLADEDDIWFHFADTSGPHLWVRHPIHKKQLYSIALTLKKNSKHRKKHLVRIVYTTKSRLEKTETKGSFRITGNAKYMYV